MPDEQAKDDGVNRSGLQYRAGYVEALKAFGVQLQVAGMRAKPKEIAGIERASQIAKALYDDMIAKMKSGV